jgi:hypothetical protein
MPGYHGGKMLQGFLFTYPQLGTYPATQKVSVVVKRESI